MMHYAGLQVARDAILRFRPNINITPYHANVKDPNFNVDFFKQFNVVLNGLDNLDARRHVNRLCLAAEVPLVESGTTGFLGQVSFLIVFFVLHHFSVLESLVCGRPKETLLCHHAFPPTCWIPDMIRLSWITCWVKFFLLLSSVRLLRDIDFRIC